MWLGQRSSGIRVGRGCQLITVLVVLGLVAPGWARDETAADDQPASAGPGRIICNGVFCELALAERTRPRVRVIVSDLPAQDIKRLRKCTGVSKPCIVNVSGTAHEHPFQIMATEIEWRD